MFKFCGEFINITGLCAFFWKTYHLVVSVCRIFNESYVPHGLKVVQVYAERGLRGLIELERRWRQHFLSSMQPNFLPPLWSVDHNHEKYVRKYGENLLINLTWARALSIEVGRGSWARPRRPCPKPVMVYFWEMNLSWSDIDSYIKWA